MTDSEDTAGDRPHRPSRLEAEVAEILARAEEPASFTEHVRRKAEASTRRRPSPPVRPSLEQFGPGSFLLGALGLAVLGALVSGVSPLLATLCAIASIASLAMVWFRRPPPGINRTKTWRGRDLGPTPSAAAWVESIRDRLRKPPR